MTKRISVASAILAGWAITLALLLLTLTPVALAHHADDHDKGKGHNASQGQGGGGDHDGDADSDPNTSYTEDNDTNDGGTPNNVEDDGDNKHPSGKDRSVEPGGSGNQGKAESDPDDDGRGPDRSNGGPDKPNGSGGDDLADQDGNNGCGNDDDFEDDNEGLCLGRQGPKDNGGNGGPGSANMTIDVDCFSVIVTSSKDISFVEVTFADGTTVKFEGLTGTAFSRTFDAPLESARAKSGTTIVSGSVGEVCDEVEGGVIENPGFPDDRRPLPDIVLGGRLTNESGPDVEASVLRAPSAEEGAVLPFTGAGISSIVLTGLFLMTAGGILTRRRK
ncbi:MAG: hypothetical protein ACRDKB_06775 [Actinomycetota bacterium]